MHHLSILHDDQELVLHGPGAGAVFRGARRAQAGRDLTVDLLLEGAPGDLLSALAALRTALDPGPRPARLRLRPEPGGACYETDVLGAELDLPGEGSEARLRGGLAVRLRVETPGSWQGELVELALNGQTGGAALGNPSGGAALEIAAGDLAGDLPASFRLELANPPGGAPLDGLLLALDWRPGGPPAGLLLEGEAGQGGTPQPDPACSGGAYARCTAPAGVETLLLAWTLSAELLAGCDGRPFRAALRLAAGAPAGTWARLELRAGGAALLSTVSQQLAGGERLALLPALRLPGGETPAPLELGLLASNPAGLTLDVDFLHLLPQDGFACLRAPAPLPPGQTLVLDGPSGQIVQRGPQGSLPAGAAAGVELRLRPARAQRLYVLHPGAVDAALTARVFARPRWSHV